MQVNKLEDGLRKIMVAAFRSKGMSDAESNAKASANMATAVARFHENRMANASAASSGERSLVSAIKKARGVAIADDNPNPIARRERFGMDRAMVGADSVQVAMRAIAAWAKTLS